MESTDVPSLMQAALAHHRAGDLHQAELIYRRVVELAPGEANAWHLLGMVAHAAGASDDAAELIAHAASLQPTVWAYRHNLAEVRRHAGRHAEAIAGYRAALAIDERQPQSHVGVAASLDAAGDGGGAVSHLRRAVELDPASAAAHYGLAGLLAADGDADAALDHARRAVELAPEEPDARERLAGLLARRGEDAAAVEHLGVAVARRTDGAADLHLSLGAALARLGRMEEAVHSFARCLAADPTRADAYGLAGRALCELGRTDEGIDCFRQAAGLLPGRADVWHDLALALERAGLTADAAAAYARAADLGMAEARLHVAALTGDGATAAAVTTEAPAGYVRRLFDDYADRFDQSLVVDLQYQTPRLILDALTAAGVAPLPGGGAAPDGPRRDAIDLGCGTGLMGELLRPLCTTLLGVDLSPKMLDKARARGVYDRLAEGDVAATLAAHPNAFDLAVAADVFVYLGDLAPTFRAAAAALRPSGLLAFSVEAADGDGYRVGPSRRFAHSEGYVRAAAAAAGLTVTDVRQATLRREKGADVAGLIVVLRKS